MYRRGPGFFPIFLLFIFMFGTVGEIIGGLFSLFLPVIMIAVIASVIRKFIGENKTASTKRTYSRTRTSTGSSRTYRRTDRTTTVTNSNQQKIDTALRDYFAHNDRMMITDNIYLANPNNKFISAEKMNIYYFDEQVCTLKEFGSRYPDLYTEILILLNKFAKKGYSAPEKKKETVKTETAPKPEKKVNKSRAEQYIDQINELNIKIENVDITNGLYQTCDLLKRIEMVDMEDGKPDEKLKKLYEYYLPILTGILEDYKRLSVSAIQGEEFKKCETQLIKTLNLINQALLTIAESMHDSDYMNLNADISTLQSLLKKDGYTQSPFKENKND